MIAEVEGRTGIMLSAVFWRLWKWLLHVFTGHCEVYRLCLSELRLDLKTNRVEQSLRNSRCQALNRLVVDTKLSVDESTEILIKEKHISSSAKTKLLPSLGPVMMRLRGVRLLLGEVELLRTQPYSQSNQDHENCLMELWTLLNPGVPLEKRLTKQWQDIGFQGDNPATDFRGMGVLSLYCLRYFASQYVNQARAVLSHSHHPTYGYPYALVGINLTSMIYSWLEAGTMNIYLYSTSPHWPLQLTQVQEIFCYLFVEFDKFWMDRKPVNVMSFPVIREEFSVHMKQQLLNNNELVMKLTV